MFGKKNDKSSSQKVDTIIGKDTFFHGEIKSTGSLRIEGEVKGNIEVEGIVLVGRAGRVEATINTESIVVAGSVQADVNCKGKLEILSQGSLVGDIESSQLVIQEGGTFIGQSRKYKGDKGEKEDKGISQDLTKEKEKEKRENSLPNKKREKGVPSKK